MIFVCCVILVCVCVCVLSLLNWQTHVICVIAFANLAEMEAYFVICYFHLQWVGVVCSALMPKRIETNKMREWSCFAFVNRYFLLDNDCH